MTEIMPAPRNSHITVLRPPSIRPDVFIFSSAVKSLLESARSVPSAWHGLLSLLGMTENF